MARRFRTVRRTTLTGVILAAAYLIYTMMPGTLGGPGDEGDSAVTAPTKQPLQDTTDRSEILPAIESDSAVVVTAAAGGSSQNEPATAAATANWLSGGVLTLLIDEYQLFARVEHGQGTRYEAISLDKAVQLAQRAAGDANGIRVRILRRETARAAAEEQLQQALRQQASLPDDAIYLASELVP